MGDPLAFDSDASRYTYGMRLRSILVLLIFASTAAWAQEYPPAEIVPVSPTEADSIEARFFIASAGCVLTDTTAVDGNTITTTIHGSGCNSPVVLIVTYQVTFGPLPAGSYTYRIVFADGPVRSTQTIEVLPSTAVPVFNTVTGGILLLAISSIALFLLRPQQG